ncbi:transcription cofactor vestigial-like protein 4 [Ambystoma mexicanum]|uniref:transcription cofactor vestigial-like protein 4 n=1 Tax=Ambystoma mexicanum TaxID=8296 RepID=UPI0037E92E81
MAVANFHYTTGISRGFKVYILEGQPSMRTEDRLRPVSNHRIPVYPIKRKLSPERHSVTTTHPAEGTQKRKRIPLPLTMERASLVTERPKVSDRERIAKLPERLELAGSPSDRTALARALQQLFPASLRLAAGQPIPLQPRCTRNYAAERPPHHQRHSFMAPLPSPTMDEPLALIKKPRSSCMPADSQTPSPVPAPSQMPSPVSAVSKTPSPVPAAMLQQMRPSVITCVANWNKQSCIPVTNSPRQETSSPNDASSPHTCDPVVEEHFRRSLGTRYCPPDSASALSIAGSVDDHFSKALGSKWLLIRQPSIESSGASSRGSPSPSSPSSRPGSAS